MKLFGFELAWAAAAFGAVFPERSALPHGIARMNPGRFLADTIATSPFEQSIGLRAALWIIALAPLWFLRKPRTIVGLAPEERQRVFEALLSSPVYAVRQLTTAFKALASMLYALSPEVRAAMTAPHGKLVRIGVRRDGSASVRPSAMAEEQGDGHEHAAE